MTSGVPQQPGATRTGMSAWAIAALVIGVLAAFLLVFGGIIAAILFPVFARARERAQQVACLSNLRQIGFAAQQYTADWNGVLPDVGTYSDGFDTVAGTKWTEGQFWGDILRDYLKAGDEIFKCPVVKDQASPSYAWNRHLSGYREDELEFPEMTPLIWDWVPGEQTAPGVALDPDPDSLDDWGYYPAPFVLSGMLTRSDMAGACSRHNGGLVLGFVDGHAEWQWPTRWTSQSRDGRFMPCDDSPPHLATQGWPWPPKGREGKVITMYPRDPRG